jgi:hypothetical protein
MKQFKVTAKMSVMLSTTMEANTLEEARELSRELDGGVFAEMSNSGEWDIIEVEEVK